MTQGVRYEPTEEQRRTVKAMAGYGMPHDDIATFLDIDSKTLRKHCTRELEMGSIEATTKVAQSLFRMATEAKNVAAAIFWMKARAGWREKQVVEHGFAPGAVMSGGHTMDEMTDEELMRIARLGLDEANVSAGQPARRRGYMIDVAPEMTPEEWQRRHEPKA